MDDPSSNPSAEKRAEQLLDLEQEYWEACRRLAAVREAMRQLQSRDQQAREEPAGRGARVLVTESEKDALSPVFEQLGCEVHRVSNAREAVESTRVRDYDLVVVDSEMPELGAAGVVRSIRERFALTGGTAPVLFIDGERSLESCRALLDQLRR